LTEISIPPLRDLPPRRLEARKRHLLGEIARLEQPGRRPLLRRPVLAAVVVAAALALTAVAVADGLGAFDGIGAAQHPQTGADVIDPATRAYMECRTETTPCMPIIRGILFQTARVVGRLPSGQNIYVVTTTSNSLCFVVGPPHPEWSCDDPLSRSHPSTVFLYGQDPAITPPTFGIALDGVTSVSFDANGREVTVPVKDNVWIYPGNVLFGAYSRLTAHFADGSTVVQKH
jgi:hypothetical protein